MKEVRRMKVVKEAVMRQLKNTIRMDKLRLRSLMMKKKKKKKIVSRRRSRGRRRNVEERNISW